MHSHHTYLMLFFTLLFFSSLNLISESENLEIDAIISSAEKKKEMFFER